MQVLGNGSCTVQMDQNLNLSLIIIYSTRGPWSSWSSLDINVSKKFPKPQTTGGKKWLIHWPFVASPHMERTFKSHGMGCSNKEM